MLSYLRISDLALIEALDFEPKTGLTILSGETGAGKSLLIDALAQLSGAALDRSLVRTGASRASIEACFVLKQLPPDLEQWGDRPNEQEAGTWELFLSRDIPITGRSSARVDGRLVPQQLLQNWGRQLIDIYGQHDQQSLFDAKKHLRLLDQYGGESLLASLAQYQDLYARYRQLRQEQHRLGGSADLRAERLQRLQKTWQDLAKAQLRQDEETLLQRKRQTLQRADQLRRIAHSITQELSGAEEEREGLLGSVDRLWRKLGLLEQEVEAGFRRPEAQSRAVDQTIAQQEKPSSQDDTHFPSNRGGDSELFQLLQVFEQLQQDIQKWAARYQNWTEELETSDPALLERIHRRLSRIEQLKRRYGEDYEGLLRYQAELRGQLQALREDEVRAHELDTLLEEAKEHMLQAGLALREQREASAVEMSSCIEKELASLGMPHARFEVCFTHLDIEEAKEEGLDDVQFLFSANPGEEAKPLARIASGGEAARIMLAIKLILDQEDADRLMIFDEVDSGVGGETAKLIGEKLSRLARHHQVMCVTHNARVAAFADHHYVIAKQQEAASSYTTLQDLDQQGQIDELARLLAGSASPTEAKALARSLYEEAQTFKQNLAETAHSKK